MIQEAASRLTLNYVAQQGVEEGQLKKDLDQALGQCFEKYAVARGVTVEVRPVAALEPVRPGSSKVCHYWNRSR